MANIKLLENVSADVTGDAQHGDGGGKVLTVYATSFGGGTVSLEINAVDPANAAAWVPVTISGSPVAITSDISLYVRQIAQNQYVRANLSGATGASNVNAILS